MGLLGEILCFPMYLLLRYCTVIPLLILAPFSLFYDFVMYLRLRLDFSRVGAKSKMESIARHNERVKGVQRQVRLEKNEVETV